MASTVSAYSLKTKTFRSGCWLCRLPSQFKSAFNFGLGLCRSNRSKSSSSSCTLLCSFSISPTPASVCALLRGSWHMRRFLIFAVHRELMVLPSATFATFLGRLQLLQCALAKFLTFAAKSLSMRLLMKKRACAKQLQRPAVLHC